MIVQAFEKLMKASTQRLSSESSNNELSILRLKLAYDQPSLFTKKDESCWQRSFTTLVPCLSGNINMFETSQWCHIVGKISVLYCFNAAEVTAGEALIYETQKAVLRSYVFFLPKHVAVTRTLQSFVINKLEGCKMLVLFKFGKTDKNCRGWRYRNLNFLYALLSFCFNFINDTLWITVCIFLQLLREPQRIDLFVLGEVNFLWTCSSSYCSWRYLCTTSVLLSSHQTCFRKVVYDM